jgi:hypothetical protein
MNLEIFVDEEGNILDRDDNILNPSIGRPPQKLRITDFVPIIGPGNFRNRFYEDHPGFNV